MMWHSLDYIWQTRFRSYCSGPAEKCHFKNRAAWGNIALTVIMIFLLSCTFLCLRQRNHYDGKFIAWNCYCVFCKFCFIPMRGYVVVIFVLQFYRVVIIRWFCKWNDLTTQCIYGCIEKYRDKCSLNVLGPVVSKTAGLNGG